MQNDQLNSRLFGGVVRVFGTENTKKIFDSHVVVVGVGGVGSWVVEVLARSGVGKITMIDFDHVAESNINRQIQALHSTLGQSKIVALAQRIADINPECESILIDDFLSAENVDLCFQDRPDVIIDCADQLSAKLAMILYAKVNNVPLIVCGSAGGKSDPLTIRVGDISNATHDPLLSKLRQQLRKQHGFPVPIKKGNKSKIPKMNVSCIWFAQEIINPSSVCSILDPQTAPQGLSCAGYGSILSITGVMGMHAAHMALLQLKSKDVN